MHRQPHPHYTRAPSSSPRRRASSHRFAALALAVPIVLAACDSAAAGGSGQAQASWRIEGILDEKYTAPDRPMKLAATLSGTVTATDGGRISGPGTSDVTVEGSCVSGRSVADLRFVGTLGGDSLRFRIIDDYEPGSVTTQMDSTMGCAIRTLRELPALMAVFAEWGRRIATEEPCVLGVPQEGTRGRPMECNDIHWTVTSR